MATFHTNGRIISTQGSIVSVDPQSVQNNNTNQNNIRFPYASIILSQTDNSFVNEPSNPDIPQARIDHVSESQNLNTLQQPTQRNNLVAFAAFGKHEPKIRSFPCTPDNQDEVHPEHPCYLCFYGRWLHLNEIAPNVCGKYIVAQDNTCTLEEYALPPCYDCNGVNGPYPVCKSCEKCEEQPDGSYICEDNCPPDYMCAVSSLPVGSPPVHSCLKMCESQDDCSFVNCEACRDGLCVPVCSSGSVCDLGVCKDSCFPPCDRNNCETCEYINGVYGCQGPMPPSIQGYYEECCGGKKYRMVTFDECEQLDPITCQRIIACPPGTTCYLAKCVPTCADDSECNPDCCETCAPTDEPNISVCVSCEEGGACVDGVCIDNYIEKLKQILGCNGCEVLQSKNTPECSDATLSCLKPECYTCADNCEYLAREYNRPFQCKQQDSGEFVCQTYDLQITSINLIP